MVVEWLYADTPSGKHDKVSRNIFASFDCEYTKKVE
jgi:hypothetical protein